MRRILVLPSIVVCLATLLFNACGEATPPSDNQEAGSNSTITSTLRPSQSWPPTKRTTTTGVILVEGVSTYKDVHDIRLHAEMSDYIAVGTIVDVSQAQWNTPDGNEMQPGVSYGYDPAVYTTYYLEPERVLKGTSKYPEPVPFRLGVGTVETEDGPITFDPEHDPKIKLGDRVLVLLKDTDRYYGGFFSPEAYWPTIGYFSVFNASGPADTFERHTDTYEWSKQITVPEVQEYVRAQAAQ